MSRRTRFLEGIFPSDIDPERRNTLMLLGGISLLVVLALLLIAFGYYSDEIKPRGKTVFKVGDRSFSYAYLEKRIDADIASGAFSLNDIQTSITNTVLKIQNEELLRQMGREKGFTASNEDIEAAMKDDIGLAEAASRTSLANALQSQLQLTGLSLDDYREVMTAKVFENKLREEFAGAVPAEAEQVDLLIIQVATREAAQAALDRIKAGEEFQDVAQQVSVHQSKDVGGEFGWAPRGLLPESLEDDIFRLTGLSEVIEDELGFFIFEVRDKQTRAIDESLKERVVSARLNTAVLDARESIGVENRLTVGQVQDLAGHIQSSVSRG